MSTRSHRPRPALVLGAAIAVLTAMVAGCVALYSGWITQAVESAPRIDAVRSYPGRPTPQGMLTTSALIGEGTPAFVALLGTDADGALELVLVAHMTADHTRIDIVTMPGSLLVGTPGERLSALYRSGGPSAVTQAVELVLGLPMNHVVVANLAKLLDIVAVIGPIDVQCPGPLTAGAYTWPAGTVSLDAAAARAYADDSSAAGDDVGRTARHAEVFAGLVTTLVQPGLLANPGVFRQVMLDLAEAVALDVTLTPSDVQDLMMDLRIQGTTVVPLPLLADTSTGYRPDPTGVAALAAELAADTVPTRR